MSNAAEAMIAAPAAAPAAPDAGAPIAAPDASAPVAPSSNDSWYSGFQNEEVKTWTQAKGFKDPQSVAESAFNLEKLIGHDKAGRTLVLPKEDATPEEIKAFHQKLGVPDSPDGYKLPVPEGQDDAFAKTAASWMHKHGIPPKQAEGLAAEWNEFQAAQAGEMAKQSAAQADLEFQSVVTGWGKDADANLEMGRRAAAAFVPAASPDERKAILSKMEMAMGTKNFLEMFSKIGSNIGEGAFIDGSGAGAMGGMSPVEAQQKIAALKSDKDWTTAYLNGDKGKLKEMENLSKLAYPTSKQS